MRVLIRSGVALAVMVVAMLATAAPAHAQTAENVAVVINEASAESRQIGEYYIKARGIPAANVIRLKTTTEESDPARGLPGHDPGADRRGARCGTTCSIASSTSCSPRACRCACSAPAAPTARWRASTPSSRCSIAG